MREFSELVKIVEILRGEKGCPWDKKQTIGDFKTFLLEEVYELVDAIEKGDPDEIKEELGDLVFHVIFISQICKEDGKFGIEEVIADAKNKIIRRHPHVFGKEPLQGPVPKMWEEIKRAEKGGSSLLEGIPKAMPALLKAYTVTRKVSRVGFDWEKVEDVYEKLQEEISELREAEGTKDKEKIKEEIGDLLFTIANISRFYGIDPEDALRKTVDKFVRRFSYIEEKLNNQNLDIQVMDRLWEEIKEKEKKGG